MTVGERLRKLRMARHLSQEEVAKHINCSRNTLSRYENDAREPSMETLLILSEFYGVSMDYLYGKVSLDEASLSDYERDLICTVRYTTDDVREDVLDYALMKVSKSRSRK